MLRSLHISPLSWLVAVFMPHESRRLVAAVTGIVAGKDPGLIQPSDGSSNKKKPVS
jgi:hypothetical protein